VAKKAAGEKITMLTAYDAWMARLLESTGRIDMLLVGDSLGMVQLGYESTVPVTVGDIVRHCQAVRRGAPEAIVVADMPFLSHQTSVRDALRNAALIMQEGGATAVKLEGGAAATPVIERIVAAGIPVVGHIGLRPQAVHVVGGYRRQATTPEGEQRLLFDALAVEKAGAFALVLEMVGEPAARLVTERLRIPTIGIGAGRFCDGQVLVTHDLLGLNEYVPSFVKRYAELGDAVTQAVTSYADDVRNGSFPTAAKRTEHA
jgi:3-methyl-2-oxobutanoate hydroxymethyltransferase